MVERRRSSEVQLRNKLNAKEIAQAINRSEEHARRLLEGKVKGGKIVGWREGKPPQWYAWANAVKDYQIKTIGIEVLKIFSSFSRFLEKLSPQVEEYLGNQPGCVMAIEPDGVPYALMLYLDLLSKNRDVTFVCLGEEVFREPALVRGRKILLVDDCTRTGGSFEVVKEALESAKGGLAIKDVKLAVYDDLAPGGKAGLFVFRRNYEEYREETEKNVQELISKAPVLSS